MIHKSVLLNKSVKQISAKLIRFQTIKELLFLTDFCIMCLSIWPKGIQAVKEYLEKYRGRLFMTGLFVFLLHGAKLHSGIIGIDTEDLIHLRGEFYSGWLHTGRQGLVFFKYLLGNAEYNPYFTGVMTLLLFTAAVAAFLGIWEYALGRNGGVWAWAAGAFLWISHPAMTEQFYFSLQSMEICISIVLTVFALYGSRRAACILEGRDRQDRRRGLIWAACSVTVLVLTFSSYQSFVVLYIFGTVTLLLLQALAEISEGMEVRAGILLRRILPYFGIFLTAFLLNTLITQLFFGTSGYLQNQIFWGQASAKDCLHGIAGHMVKAFTGYDSIFYNAGLGILALFDLGFLVRFLFRRGVRGRGGAGVVLFFYLALLITPFLMSVVLGGTPAMRSQLTLPAATAFLGYLGIWLPLQTVTAGCGTWGAKALAGCGAAICIVSGMEQAKVTESLYYTDRCRYEQDAALGREIISRIEEVNPEGLPIPVVVIGGREFSGSHACVTGEVIGRSYFNFDREVEPEFYWSTRRILGFLHTLGAEYDLIPEEWLEDAVFCSTDMPNWPAQGSVEVREGVVIVKLSSD